MILLGLFLSVAGCEGKSIPEHIRQLGGINRGQRPFKKQIKMNTFFWHGQIEFLQ